MQKTFRLSAFSFYLVAFCFLLLAFSSSCWFNPNRQTPGEVYLQGEWQQDSVPAQKKLISYSLYHLKFSCDSFFVSVKSFSKVNTGADNCMSIGKWTEYMRGTYEQKHDTLHLKGQFCNPDWTIKDDKGCFRSGDYEEFFTVAQTSSSDIRLASTSDIIPINAHLIKRTVCYPKPL
jgi:hypothetical protein